MDTILARERTLGLLLAPLLVCIISACSGVSDRSQSTQKTESGPLRVSSSDVSPCDPPEIFPKEHDQVAKVAAELNQHYSRTEASGTEESISIVFPEVPEQSLDEGKTINRLQRQVASCLDRNIFDMKIADPDIISGLHGYYEEYDPDAPREELQETVAKLFTAGEVDLVVVPVIDQWPDSISLDYYVYSAAGNSYYLENSLVIESDQQYRLDLYSDRNIPWEFEIDVTFFSDPVSLDRKSDSLPAQEPFYIQALVYFENGPGQYQWLKILTDTGDEGFIPVPHKSEAFRNILTQHKYTVEEYKGEHTINFDILHEFPGDSDPESVSKQHVDITHLVFSRSGGDSDNWVKVKFGEQEGYVLLVPESSRELRNELSGNGGTPPPPPVDLCQKLHNLASKFDFENQKLAALKHDISDYCADNARKQIVNDCIRDKLIDQFDYENNKQELLSYSCK